MTDAEKWLIDLRKGLQQDPPDSVDDVVFSDRSCVVWDGRDWKVGSMKGDNIGFRTIDKKDENKPRWSLLPAGTIRQVINVLEFGARKYQVDNWQGVPDARRRYYDAVMRHIEAWWSGEKNDPETGLPHLAHAATCLLFLMWFDDQEKNDVIP